MWENPQENGEGEEEEEELNTKQQLTKKKKKKKINGGSDETPLAHRPLSRYYQFKKNYKFNSDTTGMQMVVVVCG